MSYRDWAALAVAVCKVYRQRGRADPLRLANRGRLSTFYDMSIDYRVLLTKVEVQEKHGSTSGDQVAE
jgi:DNA phosphorothioation-dependent restriction protein DptG